MNLNPARLAEREFDQYFREAMDMVTERRLSELPKAEQDNYRKRLGELHPSSFPYCAYQHAYTELVREEDPLVYQKFGDDYFLGVGTVAHSAIQRWTGKGGSILGNHRCLKCGHVHELVVQPKKCKVNGCRGREFEYEEAGGVWGKRIYWHMDGLFRDKKGNYWVIDYKTTSVSAIWEHKKTGQKFPYVSNKAQIESYVILAEDKYKIKVKGWMLVYAARDFPQFYRATVARVVDSERKAEIRARMERDDANFIRARNIKKKPDNLVGLRKTKLCDSRQFYKDNIYDKYNPCPLEGVCFSSKKAAAAFENAFKGIPIKVEE